MSINGKMFTTPKGPCNYPWLTEKDTKFDPEGIYHTKATFKKAECETLVSGINGVIANQVKLQHDADPTKKITYANKPFKDVGNDELEFTFKTKFQPKLIDNNKKALADDVQIWKDSVVRIVFETHGYNQAVGIGCKLYPLTVQVLELVTGSPNAKLGDLKVEPDVEPKEKQEVNL